MVLVLGSQDLQFLPPKLGLGAAHLEKIGDNRAHLLLLAMGRTEEEKGTLAPELSLIAELQAHEDLKPWLSAYTLPLGWGERAGGFEAIWLSSGGSHPLGKPEGPWEEVEHAGHRLGALGGVCRGGGNSSTHKGSRRPRAACLKVERGSFSSARKTSMGQGATGETPLRLKREQWRVSRTDPSPAHLPQRPHVSNFVLFACQLRAIVSPTGRPHDTVF